MLLAVPVGALDLERALTRIAHEIAERNPDSHEVVLAGVPRGGDHLAQVAPAPLGGRRPGEVEEALLDGLEGAPVVEVVGLDVGDDPGLRPLVERLLALEPGNILARETLDGLDKRTPAPPPFSGMN